MSVYLHVNEYCMHVHRLQILQMLIYETLQMICKYVAHMKKQTDVVFAHSYVAQICVEFELQHFTPVR